MNYTSVSNSVPLSLKQATLSDLSRVAKLIHEVAAEGSLLGSQSLFNNEDETVTVLTQILGQQDNLCLLGQSSGSLAGFACAVRLPHQYTSAITGVCVSKQHRRSGIGQALMQSLLRHCLDYGIEEVYLSVLEHNQTAINLYRKLGFTVKERKKTTAYSDGDNIEEIIMKKQIIQRLG